GVKGDMKSDELGAPGRGAVRGVRARLEADHRRGVVPRERRALRQAAEVILDQEIALVRDAADQRAVDLARAQRARRGLEREVELPDAGIGDEVRAAQ